MSDSRLNPYGGSPGGQNTPGHTELARTATLIDAANRVFLREGYAKASIDRVAADAGVST